MGAGFNQWLKISKESTYGTYPTGGSPVEGTDFIWVRLPAVDNPFPMRKTPAYYQIRSADAQNRRVQTGTARYSLAGSLSTEFYPTQAAFMLAMGLTLTSNDLSSYSIDYFDSIKTHRYTGVKVGKLTLTADATSQDVKLGLDLVGQQDIASPSALAAPTQANFPASLAVPYTHQDSSTFVKLNNITRLAYSNLTFTVSNTLTPTVNELPYISSLYWSGRDVDLSITGEYLSTTDRDAYEAATPQAATNVVKFIKGPSGSPTNSVTLTFPNCYIMSVADKLPVGGAGYQDLGVQIFLDHASGSDFSLAVV